MIRGTSCLTYQFKKGKEMNMKRWDKEKAKMAAKMCDKPKVLYILNYCWRIKVRELLELEGGKEEREGMKCGYSL